MTQSAAHALEVTDATRTFGDRRALDGVSLTLAPGRCTALLGPNGAGKTTLVRSIAGRLRLDRGSVSILGRPAAEAREVLGVVPQQIAIHERLTARENLITFGRFQGLEAAAAAERADELLGWVGLEERAGDQARTFSGGMQRRLNIACSVVHRPKVLLLDEPTVGVDPQSRERIHDMLDALRDEGTALLLTTHHLDEAEARCDRVVIIDHGKVIADGTLDELVTRTVGRKRRVRFQLREEPTAPPPGLTRVAGEPALETEVEDVAVEISAAMASIASSGHQIEDVHVTRPGLHAVFIHLTGRELRE